MIKRYTITLRTYQTWKQEAPYDHGAALYRFLRRQVQTTEQRTISSQIVISNRNTPRSAPPRHREKGIRHLTGKCVCGTMHCLWGGKKPLLFMTEAFYASGSPALQFASFALLAIKMAGGLKVKSCFPKKYLLSTQGQTYTTLKGDGKLNCMMKLVHQKLTACFSPADFAQGVIGTELTLPDAAIRSCVSCAKQNSAGAVCMAKPETACKCQAGSQAGAAD